MLNWINFLHIYQPPTQDSAILKKVVDESYWQILDLFEKNPKFRISMNISSSLLEKLQENNYSDLLDKFKTIVSGGQIELVGSAFYHPILPLLPESEIRHQIKLSSEKSKEVFGDSYNPKGFYFPEMAYSKEVAKIVKELGFEWIILDEIHLPETESYNPEIKYEIEDLGLKVLFRNRKYSKGFPPESIVRNLDKIKEKYLITAHDGEMYGYWHKDFQGFYGKAFNNENIFLMTVSQYLSNLSEIKIVDPVEASWESTREELKANNPFALWNSPDNKIQKKLWDFLNWTLSIIEKNQNDPNYSWAKKHFDRGTSSCFWWWASNKKIDAFSPVSWNPTDIEKGLEELVKSTRSLELLDKKTKLEMEKRNAEILELVWKTHWNMND